MLGWQTGKLFFRQRFYCQERRGKISLRVNRKEKESIPPHPTPSCFLPVEGIATVVKRALLSMHGGGGEKAPPQMKTIFREIAHLPNQRIGKFSTPGEHLFACRSVEVKWCGYDIFSFILFLRSFQSLL